MHLKLGFDDESLGRVLQLPKKFATEFAGHRHTRELSAPALEVHLAATQDRVVAEDTDRFIVLKEVPAIGAGARCYLSIWAVDDLACHLAARALQDLEDAS